MYIYNDFCSTTEDLSWFRLFKRNTKRLISTFRQKKRKVNIYDRDDVSYTIKVEDDELHEILNYIKSSIISWSILYKILSRLILKMIFIRITFKIIIEKNDLIDMMKKILTIDSKSTLKIWNLFYQRILNYQSDIDYFLSSEEIRSISD